MSKCKGLDCCRGIRGPLTEGNAVMIMHRPPCYAYTVYLSLSLGQLALTPLHAASFHLRPTPPVRVEQQPPRTLRARSVTHPLIHTDNRFWQASPQFALARSLARLLISYHPYLPADGRKSLDSSSIVPRNSPPAPGLSPRTSVSANLQANCFLRNFTANAYRWKKKERKKEKKKAVVLYAHSLVSTATIFLPWLGLPLFFFFFFKKGSILAYRLCVTSYRLSGLGRETVYICVCVCVKNRTL